MEKFDQDRPWSGFGVLPDKGWRTMTTLDKRRSRKILFTKKLRDQTIREAKISLGFLRDRNEAYVRGPVSVLSSFKFVPSGKNYQFRVF